MAGEAYYYGTTNTAQTADEETGFGAIQGELIQITDNTTAATSGTRGNDGWGGLNLHKYEEQFGYNLDSFSSSTYTWREFLSMWQNATNTQNPVQKLTSSLRFGLKSDDMSSSFKIDYYNDNMIIYCYDGVGSYGIYHGDFTLYAEGKNILFHGYLDISYGEGFGSCSVSVFDATYINCYVVSTYTSAECY